MCKYTRNQSEQSTLSHGLVLSAKNGRTETHEYELLVFADMIELKARRKHNLKKASAFTSKRKPITKFTRKSRNNLLRRLGKARNTDRGLFITLTYPDSVLFNSEQNGQTVSRLSVLKTKQHIASLRKRIERMFPDTWTLWRLELIPRKSGTFSGELAPHFHLLHYGNLHEIAFLRRWFKHAWYEIAHDGDEHKGKAGTQLDTIDNKRHAYKYTSKYLAKETSEEIEVWLKGGDRPGRWWGVFGNYDGTPAYRIRLDRLGFIKVKRTIRGYLNSSSRFYSRRLSRVKPDASVFVFGLGDCSEGQEHNPNAPPIVRAAYRSIKF